MNENQSIHGFLYDAPIVLEIHPTDNIPDDNTSQLLTPQSQPSTIVLPATFPIAPSIPQPIPDVPLILDSSPMLSSPRDDIEEVNQNQTEFFELDQETCRKDAFLPCFAYVGKIFGEKGVVPNTYSEIWTICAIVADVDHPRTYYFKYYK